MSISNEGCNEEFEVIYQKAIAEISNWKPSKYEKVPGTVWVQSFSDLNFLAARRVIKRLQAEGLISNRF